MEEMNLTDLYSTYKRIKKNQATPGQLLKILLYGYMNRGYSSRHFSLCAEKLLAQMSNFLYGIGEISGKNIFVDGTKIESCANKYIFV